MAYVKSESLAAPWVKLTLENGGKPIYLNGSRENILYVLPAQVDAGTTIRLHDGTLLHVRQPYEVVLDKLGVIEIAPEEFE